MVYLHRKRSPEVLEMKPVTTVSTDRSPMIHIIVGLTYIATHVTDCIKILVLKEENSTIWEEVGGGEGWDEEIIALDRDKSEDSFKKVCSALESGAWLVVDLTWSGWEEVMDLPGLRYIRADVTIAPFLKALESSLIKLRNSTDAALIFQHNRHFEQSLWYLVSESSLRVTVLEGLDEDSALRLINMRPSPTSYVIIADTATTNNILQKAIDYGLVFLDDKWNFLFLDMNYKKFNISLLVKKMMDISMTPKLCCPPGQNPPCICPEPFDWETEGVTQLKGAIQTAIELSLREGLSSTDFTYDCSSPPMDNATNNHSIFYESFSKAVNESWLLDRSKGLGQTGLRLNVEMSVSGGPITNYLGTWDTELGLRPAQVLPTVKRFFRIATGFLTPFAYNVTRRNGDTVVVGYAIDLINRLAEMMNFEYELTTMWEFGTKDENGTWNGLIGLLVTGRVDMIIGALTMTSEREEVIDFVAPYFEQTGFSIVIRKPVKKTSLFKFMTVLRVEVWLSILGALCLTAIMIWLLDKYSPYSARNNKEKYPYPCRDFTLRESFWFAVTSFTPQGGGEAPKSLSARTLVAAYWLFVVLMLATFTANLAAFLTVERMQSPVQSLKHLARQSRINYTVVKNSDAHAYFENMKYAEEILYQKWKELTLNSSTDQSRFRVWDYPIKEQYGHIHNAITKAGPVANLQEGLRKVQESDDAEFALIHDHLELKYYVYSNCNLTQIGEPFAEQPYAIAVQQGSHLNEEISRRILDLQRERFFETASAKYWNSTEKAKCDSVDEDEGITLESLGGVFIATLVGLFLAMLTLGVEVWYHKKKVKGVVNTKDPKKKISIIKDEIFTSKEFSHHNISNKKTSLLPTKPKVNQIKVFPRGQLY